MKLKQYSLFTLFAGLIILAVGAVIPLVYVLSIPSNSASTGIIGGASTPTYEFLLEELLCGLPLILIRFGFVLAVCSLFCHLFSKTVETHCTIPTSLISVGLSAIGALGLYCFFNWALIIYFEDISISPVEYYVSIILGLVCLAAFILLTVFYFKQRKKAWSLWGVLIDVMTSIVFLPSFFWAANAIRDFLDGIASI